MLYVYTGDLDALAGRKRGAVAVNRIREAMRQERPHGGSLVVLFLRPEYLPADVCVKVLDRNGKHVSAPGYFDGCRRADDPVIGIDEKVVSDLVALERMGFPSGAISF